MATIFRAYERAFVAVEPAHQIHPIDGRCAINCYPILAISRGAALTLGARILEAGQAVVAAPAANVGPILVAQLQQLLAAPFCVEAGAIADNAGAKSVPFGALIRLGGQPIGSAGAEAVVQTESVAVAIDVTDSLDLDGLAGAYVRIATAKAMTKTVPAPGNQVIEPTLGVIFAIDAAVPLEELAAELERLNKSTSSNHWPDAIVIATKGQIAYMAQWLGEAKLNLLLPPSPNAFKRNVYPLYAVMMMSASGVGTFNLAMHMILGHLQRWTPGYILAGSDTVLDGVPRIGINWTGYQYNLAGELQPVPREQYRDRTMPLRSFSLTPQGQKEPLAVIAFVQWQDGGVVLLKGKLPLEAMLIFLAGTIDDRAFRNIQKVNLDDGLQLSSVLPITSHQFQILLGNIRQRGGLDVKPDQQQFVIQKFADEGSASPFIARVMIAQMKMAESLGAERESFMAAHRTLMTTLMEIRETAKDVAKLWCEYTRKIDEGSIIERHGTNIRVTENIDRQLSRLVNEFLSGATRSFKERMQRTAQTLGLNIGFLYQKQAAFVTGLAVLEQVDRPLADYLREARTWGDLLVNTRNNLDHGGWSLQTVVITDAGGRVSVDEPKIDGTPVTEWVASMIDRVLCFVEDVVAHGIQRCLDGITLSEIPIAERPPEMPLRFQNTIIGAGLPAWQIHYHASRFDET